MQKASLFGHVIEAYSEFAKNSAIPADSILRRFFLNRKYLGSTDRRIIAAAYYGAIKNFLRLEALAQDAFPTEIHNAELIIAAYFIVFESEEPEKVRQLLSELPTAFKSDYPRQLYTAMADRDREDQRLRLIPEEERLSIFYSFPLWFVKAIVTEYGMDAAGSLLHLLNSEAPTVLRVNTTITARDDLRKELSGQGIATELSKLSESGLIFQKRMNVLDIPAFKRGAFEIQDEASQLIAPFAKINSNRIKILDACAGAGGKSLHFSSLLQNHGEIFSTDIDKRKLDELKKRVVRSKAQNIRIVYPENYEKIIKDKSGFFDIVLLDVPCSGTGTLRRNPGIKWNLTEEMLRELTEKQKTILQMNKDFVKPGGTLLFATCSILKSEGEEQAEWFTRKYPEFHIEEILRTHPEIDGCDGFFAARMKRRI